MAAALLLFQFKGSIHAGEDENKWLFLESILLLFVTFTPL